MARSGRRGCAILCVFAGTDEVQFIMIDGWNAVRYGCAARSGEPGRRGPAWGWMQPVSRRPCGMPAIQRAARSLTTSAHAGGAGAARYGTPQAATNALEAFPKPDGAAHSAVRRAGGWRRFDGRAARGAK